MTDNIPHLRTTILISSATAIVVTFAALTGIGILLSSQDIILIRRIYVDSSDKDKAPGKLLRRTAANTVLQLPEHNLDLLATHFYLRNNS